MIHISPALAADAHRLALRQEDHDEATLLGHGENYGAYLASVLPLTTGLTAHDEEGNVVAMGGLSRGPGVVSPWLRCSDLIGQHKRALWRTAKKVVGRLQEEANEGSYIFNYISKEARTARAFITALGFVIVPAPVGPVDLFFLPRRTHV